MPIDTQSMLLQLQPLSALNLGGLGQRSAQRQQLALMREKFEEEKRANRESEELKRLSEAGEMRRAEMTTQRQREQAEAAAAEKRRAEAATAYADLHKAQLGNDYAGMAAAGARLKEFGGLFEQLEPDSEGRPRYRVGMDGQAYGERLAERDAVTKEMATQAPDGAVWLPPDITQQATLSRLSALGLGDLDSENIIDMGEQADTRRAQAAPALEAARQGLPAGAQRDSAAAVDEAALRLSLSPTDTMKTALDARKDASSLVSGAVDDQREADRLALDREKFEFEKTKTGEQKPLSRLEKQQLKNFGSGDAKEAYTNRLIKGRLSILEAADQASLILSDDDPNNDEKAVNLLMELNKNVGAQSNADAERMTGENKSSFIQSLKNKLTQLIKSGYSQELRQSMAEFAQNLANQNRDEIYSYIADMATAEGKASDELVREGFRSYVEENIPSHILEKYREEAGEREEEAGEPEQPKGQPVSNQVEGKKTGRLEDDQEFMDVLGAAANHFKVAADKILPLLRKESGGNPHAANDKSSARGLVQMIDKVAKEFVNPETGEHFKDADEFGALSAAEQAPVIAEYFARKGVDAASSIADYALAVAAPAFVGKSDDRDAVVYKKGSDDHKANRPWWPEGGGDITVGSILDFYLGKGKKPEGTGLAPVGEGGAAPTAKTARARAQQRSEAPPEEAEDGIPDTRPRMRHLEKPAEKKGANDSELDSLLE